MKAFAELYTALDETTKTTAKVAAMAAYFRTAPDADAAWAIYFLTGRKPKQIVPSRKLREWAAEGAGIADWLFEECYHAAGDLAETIALVLPASPQGSDLPLHTWVMDRLLPLRSEAEADQKALLLKYWGELDSRQRFVCNKLITGAFRVGVSQLLVVRALAEVAGLPPAALSHRLMGTWEPTAEFAAHLKAVDHPSADADASKPYPFHLAHGLEGDIAQLGDPADWQVEWKWDGIRSQLIRRAGQTFLWSRGEELVTERYPEVEALGDRLPEGTVLDGELLPFKDGSLLPFAALQKRIGRKNLTKKILADIPVTLLAYDLLEWQGRDVRQEPLSWRRGRLEGLQPLGIRISEIVNAASWEAFAELRKASRERGVEGFMLKRKSSVYRTGRQRGDWWKWKVEPMTVDAVLTTAQRGSGKRAGLYTDYTFAVWNAGELVPFAKAYSGLTDAEIRQVDAYVKANTLDKFGPVRAVKPELVFELAFEGIQLSTRHKSGVAVRFPRILRWRTDKPAAQADTLDAVKSLILG